MMKMMVSKTDDPDTDTAAVEGGKRRRRSSFFQSNNQVQYRGKRCCRHIGANVILSRKSGIIVSVSNSFV